MNNKPVCWSDIRDELMTPQEQADCQQWLNEFDKLIATRDAKKITAAEYCRLCFELDKKYGLAEAEDADLYLIDAENIRNEKFFEQPNFATA